MSSVEYLIDPLTIRFSQALARPHGKGKYKADPEYHKRRREELISENKKQADQIDRAKTEENKKRYKKLYDAFFARGGVAWYESLTGLGVDQDRIFSDIEYFESILELGVAVQELNRNLCVKTLATKLEKARLYERYYWRHDTIESESTRRKMMAFCCPSWADTDKMQSYYQERDRQMERTGIKHHVDHIIPIVNSKVCGLHNEFNLNVITKRANLKKSNKYSV